ncbi:hypothetical protein OC842_005952 [Tilletia horrida]|uniref:Uncharacterized protein n=1 Tax=Tilletia horrida TaxID=155126 RepID=A0AAN6G9E6_9BASI|nr:hypothetical protein OC842_005952 [Tilletia horrida]
MAQPRKPARTRPERVQETPCNIGDTHLKAVHRENKDIADQLKEAQRLVGQLTQTIARLEREIRIFRGEDADGRGHEEGPPNSSNYVHCANSESQKEEMAFG